LALWPEVSARHVHVVDVAQQAAPGAASELGQKLRLGDRRVAEAQVARGILDQDRSPERGLRLVDVANHQGQALRGVRDRQQVVQVDAAGHAPGQMLGNQARREVVHQNAQALQMTRGRALGAP
jgi:hypothetical protein